MHTCGRYAPCLPPPGPRGSHPPHSSTFPGCAQTSLLRLRGCLLRGTWSPAWAQGLPFTSVWDGHPRKGCLDRGVEGRGGEASGPLAVLAVGRGCDVEERGPHPQTDAPPPAPAPTPMLSCLPHAWLADADVRLGPVLGVGQKAGLVGLGGGLIWPGSPSRLS